MQRKSIFVDELPVLDNDFFTDDRFKSWYNMLSDFACATIETLHNEVGGVVGIDYEINTVLLQEVVYDAMIGLKTIVSSEHNIVRHPNPFKIAAYLGYWFIRHKPIAFRAEMNLDIKSLKMPLIDNDDLKKIKIVEIKHLNEVAAAKFLLRYIFVVESKKPLCNQKRCKKIKSNGNFYFEDFQEMLDTIYEKLLYHLMYRDISPKIIEHFLEAYTLHPYVSYTCDLWNISEDSKE